MEDRNGESTIQNILVQITDENDPPYISSLDGNWTSYFYHSETNTTLDLFTVVASNTETVVGDELMTYSIRQLYDHEFLKLIQQADWFHCLACLIMKIPRMKTPIITTQ